MVNIIVYTGTNIQFEFDLSNSSDLKLIIPLSVAQGHNAPLHLLDVVDIM